MKRYRKIILGLIALVVVCVAAYVIHYLVKYTFYDEYKQYVRNYKDYEEGTEFKALADSSAPEGFVLAAENDNFKLYINTETCIVGLKNKKSGKIFYSNNPEIGSKEEEGTNADLNYFLLQSQLIATYYMEGNATNLMNYNSYEYCVGIELNEGEEKHYEIEAIKDGIRIIYMLGDTASKNGMVPLVLTKERYEELLEQLDAVDHNYYKVIYGKYREDKDKPGYVNLLEKNINPYNIAKMEEALSKIGYTYDDYKEDMKEAGIEASDPVCITVPLEYRLVSDGLNVSVPTEHIVESGGAQIYDLTVLPFFNAEKNDGSDGYFLVPNGSGALINFNNGQMASNSYYNEYVYGQDLIDVERTQEDIAEDVKLPLFGIQKEDSTMLVTLDDGETYASICAMTSGVLNNYNYIYPVYHLRHLELITVPGSANPMPILEKNKYSAYLTQTYHVLPETKEYDGYSGMAKYYREMIFGEQFASKITDEAADIKMYVDILGAVKRESSFAGFKYDEVFAMTTFSQAEKMVNMLKENSVSNLVVNYQGWMNGGYYHDTSDDIKIIRKLGGKKGIASLTKLVESNGGLVYGDTAIQKVTFADEDFNYTTESSRYYGKGQAVSFGKLSPTTYSRSASLGYIENLYDLLSPKFLPRYVEAMLEEMDDFEVSGISYRDLGNVLYSDKKRKEFITRQSAKDIVLAMIQKSDKKQENLMFDNAFGYVLPYADDIINVTFYKNAYVYVNEEVPFYEMIIHGYIDYCGKSYNLNKNLTMAEECLEMIEAGAAPHFTFTWEDSRELKYTGLNNYFSSTFDVWYMDAVNMYNQVNAVLRNVSNSTMEQHEITASGSKTTYSNGTVITINKEAFTVTVDANGTTATYEFK